jgi:hypothetical protein
MNLRMTGYVELMLAGFELADGFSSKDCSGCLDAPEFLNAGSMLRHERWDGLVGTALAEPSLVSRRRM